MEFRRRAIPLPPWSGFRRVTARTPLRSGLRWARHFAPAAAPRRHHGKTSNGGTQVACNGSNINPVAINILQLKNPDGSYYIPSSSTGINQNATFSIPATIRNTRPSATLIM